MNYSGCFYVYILVNSEADNDCKKNNNTKRRIWADITPDIKWNYNYFCQSIKDVQHESEYFIWLDNRLSIAQAWHLKEILLSELTKAETVSTKLLYKCSTRLFGLFSLTEKMKWKKAALNKASDFFISPLKEDYNRLSDVLDGRLLLEQEVGQALQENDICLTMDWHLLFQCLILQKQALLLPAVQMDAVSGQLYCRRCGNRELLREISCAGHPGTCWLCEQCINMGQAKACVPLYSVKAGGEDKNSDDSTVEKEVLLNMSFELTKAQKDTADALVDYIKSDAKQCLVWAVCGAGKTEVVFAAIAETLSKGKKVLFAISRKDVVVDLEARIKLAFPRQNILTLYGGSSQKYSSADIVLSTTHQTVRFWAAFSLVILDEIDAFPYVNNRLLHYAVQRAAVEDGKIIYLSATPDKKMRQAADQRKIRLLTIPARHHGYPLPVPVIISEKESGLLKTGKNLISNKAIQLLKQSIADDGRQVFVFVPTIVLAEKTGAIVQQYFAEGQVRFSHSRDKQRDEKRDAFLRGEFPVFVTTSIMERGVTIAKADVMILFADNENIYNSSTLVQMAGRAGRSQQFPTGRVWFVAKSKTAAMKEAIKIIKAMNREATEKGYLTGQA